MAFFALSGFAIPSAAEENDTVKNLREEIELIETRLKKVEAGKIGVIQQLQDLDHKIELRRQLIEELELRSKRGAQKVEAIAVRIYKLDVQIKDLTLLLQAKEQELDQLRAEVGDRIAQLYRKINSRRVAVIFSAKSPNDLFQRQMYLRAVERYDRSKIEELIEKCDEVSGIRSDQQIVQNELSTERDKKLTELNNVRQIISNRIDETNQLESEKSEKSVLLKRINSDTELLLALLDERRKALDAIEAEIKRLDRQPVENYTEFAPDEPFKNLSGRLPWPSKNRSIEIPFGSIRHPTLKTVTINPGIDIKATAGDPVFSVAKGQVTRISYLRGFGNTVILSHGDGYYTVYARLGQIFVNEGEVVKGGTKIGATGEAGSEENLHFEIWSNREKQNPLKWLKKG